MFFGLVTACRLADAPTRISPSSAYATIDGEIRAVDRFGIDFRTYSSPPKGLLEARVNVLDARQRQQTLAAVAAVVQLIVTLFIMISYSPVIAAVFLATTPEGTSLPSTSATRL